MKSLTTAIIALLVALQFGCGNSTYPDYDSISAVKGEQSGVKNRWYGKGKVIIGRLEMPEDARVVTRTHIYKDGSFCTALYSKRELIFYAHGYEPLLVSKYTRLSKNTYDAGTLSFTKSDPKSLRQLQGTVTLNQTANSDLTIECALIIRNKNYLLDDHGYSGGSSISVTVEKQELSNGQAFEFSPLSKIPYTLVLTAPGYIKEDLSIKPEQSGRIDLGKIVLNPAKKFQISYKSRVRQDGGKWIGDDAIKTITVICDGKSEFQFSDQRDGLGNKLELRMKPDGEIVEASFFYRKPNSFFRLRSSNSDGMPDWAAVDTSTLKGDTKAVMQEGQLYYFTVDDINETEIQLLFQIGKE